MSDLLTMAMTALNTCGVLCLLKYVKIPDAEMYEKNRVIFAKKFDKSIDKK